MGSLQSDLNFFQDFSADLDSRLSLPWDTLYFLESLATLKVRKFAKNHLRRTRRGPRGNTDGGRQLGVRN